MYSHALADLRALSLIYDMNAFAELEVARVRQWNVALPLEQAPVAH